MSFSTLQATTILALSALSSGALICIYEYSPKDVQAQPEVVSNALDVSIASVASTGAGDGDHAVSSHSASETETDSSTSASFSTTITVTNDAVNEPQSHVFHAVCWRGSSKTINVMCNKIGK